jgi:hypothetical protein
MPTTLTIGRLEAEGRWETTPLKPVVRVIARRSPEAGPPDVTVPAINEATIPARTKRILMSLPSQHGHVSEMFRGGRRHRDLAAEGER